MSFFLLLLVACSPDRPPPANAGTATWSTPSETIDASMDSATTAAAGGVYEGAWGGGALGMLGLATGDIDGDGLDEVVAGAPKGTGALVLLDDDLSHLATVHAAAAFTQLGLTVEVVPSPDGPRIAAHERAVGGVGALFVVDPARPDLDGQTIDAVAELRATGPGGGAEAQIDGLHLVRDELWVRLEGFAPYSYYSYTVQLVRVPLSWTEPTLDGAETVGLGHDLFGWMVAGDGRATAVGDAYTIYWYPLDDERELHAKNAAMLFVGGDDASLVFLDEGGRSLLTIANDRPSPSLPGSSVFVVDMDEPTVLATIRSSDPARLLGFQVLAPGDLDGDGVDDLVVSAPGDRQAASGLPGEVYVFRGPVRGDLTPADADYTFTGIADDGAGSSLASGDFDGDGRPDLVIGRPGYPGNGFEEAGRIDRVLGAEIPW